MTRSKMNILNSLIVAIVAVFALFAFALFSSTITLANGETAETEMSTAESVETTSAETTDEDLTQTATVETPAPTSQVTYKYIAERCDSLTKLVRRSLLVYDAANEDIQLTKEGIVYAETNIVQKMGAYWLEIGDEVVISGQDVETYALKSLGLDPDTEAAWATYVPMVDYELADIQQPQNVEQVVEDIQEEVKADKTEADDTEDVTTEEDGASAIWWFVGIGAVAVVWYLLWKRDED